MSVRKLTRGAFLFISVFVLVVVLGQSANAQKKGGTLIYMIPASGAPSLDAHRETTFATIHPVAPFYSLLIQVDPRSKLGKKLSGDLAESWKVSKDKKTYTFKIRRNVQFHDGTPLKARDIKASFDKMVFPPKGVLSPRKAYFSMVDKIETPNDYTVVFKLKFPSGAFLPAVAMPYNFIYSADQLAKDIKWYESNVLGSGPFKFVEYISGSKMVGKRNENYYIKGLPYLDGFEAIFAKKQNVQVQAIRGGRAHSMFRGLPPAAKKDLERAMGNKVRSQQSTWNCALYATVNTHKKPFDDIRVRQALNLAVDRWGGSKYLSQIAIVKTAGGVVFPSHPLAPSQKQLESLPGFSRNLKKSRAEARRLLKEAGIPKGFKFVLHNRNTDQPYKIVGTWLIDQWRQVGLNVEQWVQPTSAFYKTLRTKPVPDFDVSMDFNCQAIVNPTLDVSKVISWDRSPANNGAYIDRELDKMFDAQLQESNTKKQKDILWKFQQRVSDQAIYLHTLWWHRTIVHSSKMKYWEVTPSHYLNMGLAHVWLDQ